MIVDHRMGSMLATLLTTSHPKARMKHHNREPSLRVSIQRRVLAVLHGIVPIHRTLIVEGVLIILQLYVTVKGDNDRPRRLRSHVTVSVPVIYLSSAS